MRSYIRWDKKTHFVFPIDVDVLNTHGGEVRDGKLYVKAMVESYSDVTVNGVRAEKIDGLYVAEVCISEAETKLTARSADGENQITVFTVKKPTGYYRLSSDDNIISLYDINKNKDVYTSIFDNPYLAVYKKSHDLYGAAVHLNIYCEMPPSHPGFSSEREYFNLSMMTDKFKDEWKANSSWLKLNFHANADKPDMPYKNTDYDTIYRECKRVMGRSSVSPVKMHCRTKQRYIGANVPTRVSGP